MKYFSHINTAAQILQNYDGKIPFGSFIKQFFSLEKKYGSKDRKNISQLCYAFFRLGKALPQHAIQERILAGLFLCSNEPNELLQQVKPEYNEHVQLPLAAKLSLIVPGLSLHHVFPWQDAVSEALDYDAFCASFFTQPDLFLRIRPSQAALVKSKLQQAVMPSREVTPTCLALPNTSKVDAVLTLDKEAVIQDYSSQRVGAFMEIIRGAVTPRPSGVPKLWDACAASGGKSILATDTFGKTDLFVSDVRKTILYNLERRFTNAGIKQYSAFTTDLSAHTTTIPYAPFDIIITDVPCSGSGTWSRTPEQLYYFDEKEIERYSTLQKKIVGNAIPNLQPGGFLLYCTCSVFKKENEAVVEYISKHYGLQLQKMELLTGYAMKADTLFAALFQKPIE